MECEALMQKIKDEMRMNPALNTFKQDLRGHMNSKLEQYYSKSI